jgi:hypothetical protein
MNFRRSKISFFKTDNKKVVKTDKHHKLDGITENISEEIEQNKDRKIEEKKGNTETTKCVFNRCKETTENKINDKIEKKEQTERKKRRSNLRNGEETNVINVPPP